MTALLGCEKYVFFLHMARCEFYEQNLPRFKKGIELLIRTYVCKRRKDVL